MQERLSMAKGVPAKVISATMPVSTLDSVVHTRKGLGENHIAIISQEFHNQRAIWLAKPYHVDTIGLTRLTSI
ncbi:ElyC/SanA/YdcF family protein [Shigella flexneri]